MVSYVQRTSIHHEMEFRDHFFLNHFDIICNALPFFPFCLLYNLPAFEVK